jgi:hypothetical protein
MMTHQVVYCHMAAVQDQQQQLAALVVVGWLALVTQLVALWKARAALCRVKIQVSRTNLGLRLPVTRVRNIRMVTAQKTIKIIIELPLGSSR